MSSKELTNWIFDPEYWWNVPPESWQQDDAIVDRPQFYVSNDIQKEGIFQSSFKLSPFERSKLEKPKVGFLRHSDLNFD